MPYLAGSRGFFLIDAPLLFSELSFSISVPWPICREPLLHSQNFQNIRRMVAVNIQFAGDPSGG
jgi:hypothetical protein